MLSGSSRRTWCPGSSWATGDKTLTDVLFLAVNDDELMIFADLNECLTIAHTLIQGEPGPDAMVGLPGVRGPQV